MSPTRPSPPAFVTGFLSLVFLPGCTAPDLPDASIEGERRPVAVIADRAAAQTRAAKTLEIRFDSAGETQKQILFGDLHVHTTYSVDAFIFSLPFLGGEGTHPPADACDFARHCSAVDFFSINDHAEGLLPELWRRTKETIRQCNERSGDPTNPDLVAYVGWEWTQVGATPEEHHGHRNVIFRDLEEETLPLRPIDALSDDATAGRSFRWLLRSLGGGLATVGLDEYADFLWFLERLAGVPRCAYGIDTRELPENCREGARTPRELFEKLEQWGAETLVIPHGLAWGVHAPPGARLDHTLNARQHDPSRERLLEISSGHGNAEEYRRRRSFDTLEDGTLVCPEPSKDFLPCCWRAGEIMRERCGDLPGEECERRVTEARRLALEAGTAPHLVFPDTGPEEWLDCDQCRDCFKPAMTLRPGMTAQYSMAIRSFGEDAEPRRFRWGFIASTDNHTGRPATGYKQYDRPQMTDARGPAGTTHEWFLRSLVAGRSGDPREPKPVERKVQSLPALLDTERNASFMYPGGIVAVHAEGRDRDAIWKALERKEVYGTSGPRILLWFDLLNGPEGRVPMGSLVAMREAPRFEVRAVGSFVQRPGCPEEARSGLSAERLEKLCRGECYHPGDERIPIVAIEVVRIRPQTDPAENIANLIEDPWKRFECDPDPAGCVVSFEDPELAAGSRDTVYYVRALQEETPAINGNTLRPVFDEEGNVTRVSPCFGGYRTPPGDDCLAPVNERAWSSPIFVDFAVTAPPSS